MNRLLLNFHPRIVGMKPVFGVGGLMAISAWSMLTQLAAAGDGAFSSSYLGTGNVDASIGLDASRNYINAVDLNGSGEVINGVTFSGSSGASPSGTGTGTTAWSLTGAGGTLVGGTPNDVTGSLGTLLNDFNYGGNPGTINLTGLTAGTTYTVSVFNRSYGNDAYRRETVASTTTGASTIFNADQFIGSQGDGNVLRYSFVATGATESLNFTPVDPLHSMHFYGFATEDVFNKNFTSGTTWSGSSWSTAGVPNAAGANAAFGALGAPTSISLDVPTTLGSLKVDSANALTLSGPGTLTLQGDVGASAIVNTTTGNHVISAPVTVNSPLAKFGTGSVEFTGPVTGSGKGVTVGSGSLVLSGGFSNLGDVVNSGTLRINNSGAQSFDSLMSGPGGLQKSGAGTLTVGAPQTYTGPTSISGGTLKLGSSTRSLSIYNSNFESPSLGGGGWSYNTSGTGWTFSTSGLASSGSPWVGTAAEGNQVAFIQSAGGTDPGISQAVDVNVAGNYTFSFNATNRPTYSATDITIKVDGVAVGTIPAASINNGGAFQTFTASGVAMTAGRHTISFIGASASPTDTATTLDAIGASTVMNGLLPATSALSLTNGATLDLNGQTQPIGQVGAPGTGNGIAGNIIGGTLNIQNNQMYVKSGTISASLAGTGTNARLWIGGDNAATVQLGGVNSIIFGDHHSTIIGHGTTGAAGTVQLLTPTALGPNTEQTQIFDGILDLNGQTNITAGELFSANTGAARIFNSNTSSTASFNNSVLFTGAANATTGSTQIGGAGNISLGGVVSGTGGINKVGAGTLFLAGTNNSYTGVTIVGGGILNVASVSNYGVASSLGNRAADTGAEDMGLLFRGGTLQYTGSTPQSTNRQIRVSTAGAIIDASGSNPAATLSFTQSGGNLNLFETGGTRTITLTGSNTGENTFAIGLQNQGGNATSLTKSGTGKWVMSGSSNISGPVSVLGGELKVTGTLLGGMTTVSSGAKLSGVGTLHDITLNSGSTVAPGSSIGTLNADNLTWNGGATMAYELGALNSSDLITLTANFNKGSAGVFAFDFLGTGTTGTYTLVNFASTTFTASDFAASNLASGYAGTFQQNARNLVLNVVAVPEPSSLLAIAISGLALCARRKRS